MVIITIKSPIWLNWSINFFSNVDRNVEQAVNQQTSNPYVSLKIILLEHSFTKLTSLHLTECLNIVNKTIMTHGKKKIDSVFSGWFLFYFFPPPSVILHLKVHASLASSSSHGGCPLPDTQMYYCTIEMDFVAVLLLAKAAHRLTPSSSIPFLLHIICCIFGLYISSHFSTHPQTKQALLFCLPLLPLCPFAMLI